MSRISGTEIEMEAKRQFKKDTDAGREFRDKGAPNLCFEEAGQNIQEAYRRLAKQDLEVQAMEGAYV